MEINESRKKAVLEHIPFLPTERFLIDCAERKIFECIDSARKVPLSIIDRDISEQSQEVDFMMQKVGADASSYAPEHLRKIVADILVRKARVSILKSEYMRRTAEANFC